MVTFRGLLGDLMGGLSYFGSCFGCGSQFVSTNAKVVVVDGCKRYCHACSHKKVWAVEAQEGP